MIGVFITKKEAGNSQSRTETGCQIAPKKTSRKDPSPYGRREEKSQLKSGGS